MTNDHTAVVLVPVHRGEVARRFFETLGFAELSHGSPVSHGAATPVRNAWLARGDVRIHLHVAPDGVPLEPVKLAIETEDPMADAERCWNAGYSVLVEHPSPGCVRLFVMDPFENQVELLGPADAAWPDEERCA